MGGIEPIQCGERAARRSDTRSTVHAGDEVQATMGWTGWRRVIGRAGARRPASASAPEAPLALADVREALTERGVPDALIVPLARRLVEQGAHRSGARFADVVDGIALAFELHRSTQDQLSRSLRGLREVERMMGAFSGELTKLDEVLGVLAAYVRRMRSSGSDGSGRTLH